VSHPNERTQQPSSGPTHPVNASSPRTNRIAVAALVCAILFAPLGLILGYMAESQIKRTGEHGSGLTRAALIIGWIQVLPALLAVLWVGCDALARTVHAGAFLGYGGDRGDSVGGSLLLVIVLVLLVAGILSAKKRRYR